ncbi:rhodanese-like domain-containing protein [Tepidibacter aestuarii]|uniref:rhodanese-like domain-containing protein n=1 Tax=Tepidibacter aestuarii TaxID=2925782 RepID=UPI0020BF6D49|nr:rhodanese-like domain-containing protein [Tepidibacter aestuarii]CAH2214548.1 phage shock protein E [Tepidibacter aestuarii]
MNFIQRLFGKKSNFKNIKGEEAESLIKENKDMLILDVRTLNEYKSGHIPKAKNIPINDLQLKINSIKKYQDKSILVYCASGARSRRASNILSKSGFNKIYNLSRGMHSVKK